jgi:hypothetical protein
MRSIELLVDNADLLLHLEGSVLEGVEVVSHIFLDTEESSLREARRA